MVLPVIEQWRRDFEKAFKVPEGIYWDEQELEYKAKTRKECRALLDYCLRWDGWYYSRFCLVVILPKFDPYDRWEAAEAIESAEKSLNSQGIFSLTEWDG